MNPSSPLNAMCLTWRHDFFLLGIEERDELRRKLRPLYEHHVKPLMKENAELRAQLSEVGRLCAELNAELHPNGDGPESPSLCDLVAFVRADRAALRATLSKAEAERDALLEALQPSAETKGEYLGEFSFKIEYMDEEGEERLRKVTVPWTTTKDIMKAIRTRAGVASYRRNTSDVVSSETPETLHNGQHQPSGEE